MPPAGEYLHTRTALAAHQAGALRWLGGGVIAVVLGVLLGAAAVALAENGRRVPALGLVVLVMGLVGLVAVVAGTRALLRTYPWRPAPATTPRQPRRLRIP